MPVLDIYKTFKRKNTKHMPFPMISSGTLVGFAWLLHGIIINSGFIIVMGSKKIYFKLAALTIISFSSLLLGPEFGHGWN